MVVSHGGLSCCFHTMAKQVSHSGPQWPTVAANPILKKTGEWGKAVGWGGQPARGEISHGRLGTLEGRRARCSVTHGFL